MIQQQCFKDEEEYHAGKMSSEEIQESENLIQQYHTKLHQISGMKTSLEEQIDGKTVEDLEEIQVQIQSVSQEQKIRQEEYLQLYSINKKNREIREHLKRYFEKTGSLQKQYEVVSNLSKTANGTLSGAVKMDFETYVQRQYFKQQILLPRRRPALHRVGQEVLLGSAFHRRRELLERIRHLQCFPQWPERQQVEH